MKLNNSVLIGVNLWLNIFWFVPECLTVPLRDATGVEVNLTQEPKRIISLAPSITEQLFTLGIGNRIVGVTTYCTYPAEAKSKPKIGTYLQPNLEKIISLHPDLVLATVEGQRKEMVYKLRQLGLKVYTFPPADNFTDLCTQHLELARLVNREKVARKLVTKLQSQVNKIVHKTKSSFQPVKVFWQLGSNPLITVNKDTFHHELITLAGGINIAQNSKIRYPKYNREEVIRQNPEVIIIIDAHGEMNLELSQWQKFPSLNAVKNRRIYIVDGDKVCRPTPQCFTEGVKEIYHILLQNKTYEK